MAWRPVRVSRRDRALSVRVATTGAALIACWIFGCAPRAASLPSVESTTPIRTPECYSLAYSEPVKDASPKLFPVWVELLPGASSGSVVGRPHPDLGPADWAALWSRWWKKLPPDSIEVNFSGNYEAAVIHVHRMGSQIVGRATWLSDVIESGPKPSMRVEGERVVCEPVR
jgi:hypothetical protein